jgi:hypothetical protein
VRGACFRSRALRRGVVPAPGSSRVSRRRGHTATAGRRARRAEHPPDRRGHATSRSPLAVRLSPPDVAEPRPDRRARGRVRPGVLGDQPYAARPRDTHDGHPPDRAQGALEWLALRGAVPDAGGAASRGGLRHRGLRQWPAARCRKRDGARVRHLARHTRLARTPPGQDPGDRRHASRDALVGTRRPRAHLPVPSLLRRAPALHACRRRGVSVRGGRDAALHAPGARGRCGADGFDPSWSSSKRSMPTTTRSATWTR